ncbi:hypothetical protein L218DRAFT_717724 [Marasmius fiardii PR-910]|nr:hypothetical protein L218DRAFT_717724 [Marasmius fiardii PR-910]
MYYLSLNRAALILIPPQEALGLAEATVVQVFIKTSRDGIDNTNGPSINQLAMYYDIQVEVTQAIRNLVGYDLASPLTLPDEKIEIDGRNYILRGKRPGQSPTSSLDL